MLLKILSVAIAIQILFFSFAFIFKTDKFTDMAYGLTFIIIALWLQSIHRPDYFYQNVLLIMIVAWGSRLSTYLFMRILKIKKDKRFNKIRTNFLKFLSFWLFQGLSVVIILLPSIVVLLSKKQVFYNPIMFLGTVIFIFGLIIEAIADQQKFKFKSKLQNKDKFISTGLWHYSRHPNYFGEILVWTGIFIYAVPVLQGLEWLTVLSPLYITFLLLFVSGIPTLEKRYDQKYQKNREYQKYKKTTSKLIPLPKK